MLSKRSDMDHTVPTPCLPFLRKRSPDGATTTESADIQLQLTTHLSTPKGVGLVGWPIVDALSP